MAERTIGQRIKAERDRHRWTQKELSAQSGVPQSRISELERGHLWASAHTVLKLARALGVGYDELIEGPSYQGIEPADTDEISAVSRVGSHDASRGEASA